MTDPQGNVQYEYNGLSQLIAETRQFNDTLVDAPLSNSRFKIEYNYGLAGQLKSITDPYGIETSYDYDRTGRLSGVTGTTFA